MLPTRHVPISRRELQETAVRGLVGVALLLVLVQVDFPVEEVVADAEEVVEVAVEVAVAVEAVVVVEVEKPSNFWLHFRGLLDLYPGPNSCPQFTMHRTTICQQVRSR